MEFQQILESNLFGIPAESYLLVLMWLCVGFVGRFLVRIAFARMEAVGERKGWFLRKLVVNAIGMPLGWIVIVAAVWFAASTLPFPRDPFDFPTLFARLARAGSLCLGVWMLTRLIDNLCQFWATAAEKTETKVDDQLVPLVRSVGKNFVILIGAVQVLDALNYSVTSLLAGVGIGGAAVAFAAKDSIANLFGSLVIFIDRPFHIGDWIEVGKLEGTVEEVSVRSTRIRTFANSQITVPNAIFTSEAVNNWSRMQKRRIKMTIGLTYDTSADKMDAAVEKVREIIRNDPKMKQDFFLVNFDAFGASSLDIFIYCFTVTTNWGDFLQAKQEFMLKIMREFNAMGLSFAFPTQTIHVADFPGVKEGSTKDRPD